MEHSSLRQSERVALNGSAIIRTEDNSFNASCLINNLSKHGAKLRIATDDLIPSEFILCLRPGSLMGRHCQMIWRIGNKVGVRFTSTSANRTDVNTRTLADIFLRLY
jgi:hypothetical protein